MSSRVAGLDIGTTSAKAAVFDIGEGVEGLGEHAVEYPLYTPEPGAAEQDAEAVLLAALEALAGALKASDTEPDGLTCVGLSSAMHGLVAVDDGARPITPVYTYADTRAAAEARTIRDELDGLAVYKRTGTPLHAMTPLAKLRWLRKTRPDDFKRAHRFVSLKELLVARLFGETAVDHSIAAATGLFSLEDLDWDERALGIAGVTRERLSPTRPTRHLLEGLDGDIAGRLNLARDTPFVLGASDGCLANLGTAAIDPGVVAVTVGTSGAVRSVTDEPLTDERGRTFCYPLTEESWVVGGPISNGGIVLRWLRDELGGPERDVARHLGVDPYDVLTEMAGRVGPGADGLVFLPHLAGERAPNWESSTRGTLFGLSLNHRKEHIVRALLEGVVFSLVTVERVRAEVAGKAREIRASGGFTRSRLWRQILADVFETKVTVSAGYEASCLGAALLGLVAVGELDGISSVPGMITVHSVSEPDSEHRSTYRAALQLYLDIYDSLRPLYERVVELQHRAGVPAANELGAAG